MNKTIAFLLALALLPVPAMAQTFAPGNLYLMPPPTAPGSCLVSTGLRSAPAWSAGCVGGGVVPLGSFPGFQSGIHSSTLTISGGSTDTINGQPCSWYEIYSSRTAGPILCVNTSGAFDFIGVTSSTVSAAMNLNAEGALNVEGTLTDGAASSGVAGQVLSSTGTATLWATPTSSNPSANGATESLGNVGAPTGACISGSIYTRSDGAVGSTLYACEASAWVAASTP